MDLKTYIKNEAYTLLKKLNTANEVPFWYESRKQLLHLIINDNLDNFLSWQLIRNTMYVVNTDYSKHEYDTIMQSEDYVRWSYCLLESGVGRPVPSHFSSGTCDNLVHTIYHLDQFQTKTKTKIDNNKTIIEFGGGYGCMANVIKKMNFCNKYVIFDFPEFNLLQKFYLLVHGVPVCNNISEFLQKGGIYLTSEIQDIKAIQNFDLFIGTWSISEAPINFRIEFLNSINCNNFLFAYQKQFDDSNSFNNVDNNDFFNSISNNSKYNWINYKIDHLFGEQYYLFGSIKT